MTISKTKTNNKNKNYKLLIGRHCSSEKPSYLLGAVKEAVSYDSNALMIYLGAPQNSDRKPASELKVPEFKEILKKNKIDVNSVVVHGPYLLNLANSFDKEKFDWSVNFLKEEMELMKQVGLKDIIIHPGSALTAKPELALAQIAKGLNLIFAEVPEGRILLETMSGRGSEVGKKFEELKYIIDRVEQPERVGICWDTCHLYAAGYDIKNNLEGVIKEFDKKVGLGKLWVIHVNDTSQELGAKIDRHENIGFGNIGSEVLKKIVWHPKLDGKIKILETPRKREKEDKNFLKNEIRGLKEQD